MESPGRSGDAETLQETEGAKVCLCPPSCSAHDITSMSDLPDRRMKTKMWPMSPIETLTQEEVLSIANRDRTPVMIAVVDGDASREQYLCSNKRDQSSRSMVGVPVAPSNNLISPTCTLGPYITCIVVPHYFWRQLHDKEGKPSRMAKSCWSETHDGFDQSAMFLPRASLPPEVAAEGSWAQKYYQQVAILTDSLKEMQESFQPMWELAKSQQALLVSVEIFDGLLAVANEGTQVLFKSWSLETRKAIITKECDFRTHKQADYYMILKNYTMKRFEPLDQNRFHSVEDL